MIPIRDVIPSRTTPWITLGLIVLHTIVFLFTWLPGPDAFQSALWRYGLVPANFSWPALLASLFVHSGWLHLLSNMWALWLFGENVEDRLGRIRFLLLYVFAGIVSSLVQAWAEPLSEAPQVGPTGAIAGVMGTYLLMFPQSKVLVLGFFLFKLDAVETPAPAFMGLWLVLQIFCGAGRLEGGLFAYWPIVAGVAFGLAAGRLLRSSPRWSTAT